jgi:hypothetical protein
MDTDKDKQTIESVDPAGVQATDHLLIRDVDSGKVLVNIRNTAKNLPLEDSDSDEQA